jgi:hypothetical protein
MRLIPFIYKNDRDCELLDALTIKSENAELFIEKYDPEFSKNKVKNIYIDPNACVVLREDGVKDTFPFNTQDRVIEFLKKLANSF